MPAGAVILARMPYTLKEALDAYANAHNLSTTEAIRQACAALVGYSYPQQNGNTLASIEAKRRARNIKQRERASQRRALIRRLNTNGDTNINTQAS